MPSKQPRAKSTSTRGATRGAAAAAQPAESTPALGTAVPPGDLVSEDQPTQPPDEEPGAVEAPRVGFLELCLSNPTFRRNVIRRLAKKMG